MYLKENEWDFWTGYALRPIHGDFASNRIELIDGKKQQVYGWVFNKLKTKKGCHGYFGCNK